MVSFQSILAPLLELILISISSLGLVFLLVCILLSIPAPMLKFEKIFISTFILIPTTISIPMQVSISVFMSILLTSSPSVYVIVR